MVILNGKINPSQILGSFHIKRIRSPYTDTANLIQITQYTPNPMASESIDSGLLEISLTENQDRKWLLNLAMYNPVSFFDSTFFFYVDMLVAERDYKRERTADSIIQSLNAVQDRWIQEFYIGKGYNLLDKNFPGKKNFIH
jgi:hypothetical protein